MIFFSENGNRVFLDSPLTMPRATGFLWNKTMMIQMSCRGYAHAQFMQPEPSQYSRGPNIEAHGHMQPEQPYYTHHPGRFFYLRDEESGEVFSLPYEPVRRMPDSFQFSHSQGSIDWSFSLGSLNIQVSLQLPVDDPVELWSFKVENRGSESRRLSIFPYFSIGYLSWMNQSAGYNSKVGAIVANSVTPYRKYTEYFENKNLKDKTYLLCQTPPIAWHTQRESFEGEGGLHNPDALGKQRLSCSNAYHETPVAVVQYEIDLRGKGEETLRFAFGPAVDEDEILRIRSTYLSEEGFARASREYTEYIDRGKGTFRQSSPNRHLDNFVNHWLPRQIYYHGDVNRLTTDPQTRNYLQDNMGMVYIDPAYFRRAFLFALSQQKTDGSMPDGILLHPNAELKYINQIPHTDHCVWLPICLEAYLDETDDFPILDTPVLDGSGNELTVSQRVSRAMDWLYDARDYRGLSYIAQGDWNDPMNMVGYKGRGVSAWLTIATAYAFHLWARICTLAGDPATAKLSATRRTEINTQVNDLLWDGQWYARGITDDDRLFGIHTDEEGKIFLNPQSWAILAGTSGPEKNHVIIKAVEEYLETPYGPALLAPAYTKMREDVGRVTQKFPGTAENGSVYNHAAIFYIYSLYVAGYGERAYRLLRQMISGPEEEDLLRRGQLPVFIPNYYRGAYHQYPEAAGKSSDLFNTGTVGWVYRCLIEGLFGLKGERKGLAVKPQLPNTWDHAQIERTFRGATFHVSYRRRTGLSNLRLTVDGHLLAGNLIESMQKGKTYEVLVEIPREEKKQ